MNYLENLLQDILYDNLIFVGLLFATLSIIISTSTPLRIMPNWCYNRVRIDADPDQVKKLKEIHDIFEKYDDPFNQILPIPDFKNIPNEKGELPKLEQMKNPDGSILWETYNFPDGKNDDRWYYWCIDNWGTKGELSELDIEYDEEMLELTFSTAWSPPEGVMNRLKEKYPDLSFTCFYDEPGMEIAGYY